jgi:F-type H+-transporting ATPase subunit alpha
VPVPSQIAVLLALGARLFDEVPLERMIHAEQAVREAAENLPAELCERLESADELSDEYRAAIVDVGRQALAAFSSDAAPEPEP